MIDDTEARAKLNSIKMQWPQIEHQVWKVSNTIMAGMTTRTKNEFNLWEITFDNEWKKLKTLFGAETYIDGMKRALDIVEERNPPMSEAIGVEEVFRTHYAKRQLVERIMKDIKLEIEGCLDEGEP